jgi:hypothetical protein
MYCPGCGTQNLDEAKFCRVCGTNLATVALALTEHAPNLSNRDSKIARLNANSTLYRRQGMKKIIEGSGLVAASTLVGAALGVFSNQADWIMIWLIFGAWLAVFGVLSLAKGIGSLIESKYALKQIKEFGVESVAISPPTEFKSVASANTSPTLTPVTSVTEHTTKLLDEAQVQNGK